METVAIDRKGIANNNLKKIQEQFQLEDYLKDKNRHGEVEITFNVTSTGAITDIKINKNNVLLNLITLYSNVRPPKYNIININ
mgnify:CR=1 FL=1